MGAVAYAERLKTKAFVQSFGPEGVRRFRGPEGAVLGCAGKRTRGIGAAGVTRARKSAIRAARGRPGKWFRFWGKVHRHIMFGWCSIPGVIVQPFPRDSERVARAPDARGRTPVRMYRTGACRSLPFASAASRGPAGPVAAVSER